MYWKIARTLAKLINIVFLIFVCIKISSIYYKIFSDEKLDLMKKNTQSDSVFYYDINSFPYFIQNYDDEKFSIFNYFGKVEFSIKDDKEKSSIFRKIMSHRLSLVYLFSIFFGDIIKVIYTMGVI